jgi:hypothetical protein
MNLRYCHLLLLNIFVYTYCFAQISVTIPSSPALTIDFGNGKINPGPPFKQFYSDFTYTVQVTARHQAVILYQTQTHVFVL